MLRILLFLLVLSGGAAVAAPATSAQDLPADVPEGAEPAQVWGCVDGEKYKVRIGDKTRELNLMGAAARIRKLLQ